MTDGGHVPSEGLPEHLLVGSDPAGRPEGVAVSAAPAHGVPVQGVPAQSHPAHAAQAQGTPGYGVPVGAEAGFQRPGFTFLDQPDQLEDEEDVLLMPGPQASWGEPLVHGPADPSTPVETLDAGIPADTRTPDGRLAENPAASDTVALRALGAELTLGTDAPGTPPGTPVEPSWPPLAPPALTQPQEAPVETVPVAVPVSTPAAEGVADVVAPAAGPAAPETVGLQAVAVQPQEQLTPAQPPRRPLHAGPPIPDPSLMTGHVPVRSLADRGPSHGSSTPAHGVRVAAPPVQPQPAVPAQPAVSAPPAQAPAPQVPVAQAQPAEPSVPAPSVPDQLLAESAVLESAMLEPSVPVQAAVEQAEVRSAPPAAPQVTGPAVVEPAASEAPAEVSAPAAPETSAPETAAPETSAPETSAPETSAPETAAEAQAADVQAQAVPVTQAPVGQPSPDVADVADVAVVPAEAVLSDAAPVVSVPGDAAPAEPVFQQPVAVAAPVLVPVTGSVPVPPAEPVAAPAPTRAAARAGRISAFLAAPTPHGLPTVEAEPAPAQPVPADRRQEEQLQGGPGADAAADGSPARSAEAAPETAAGTGDMARGQAADAPAAVRSPAPQQARQQPQEFQESPQAPEPRSEQAAEPQRLGGTADAAPQSPEPAPAPAPAEQDPIAPEPPVTGGAEAPTEDGQAEPPAAPESEEGTAITTSTGTEAVAAETAAEVAVEATADSAALAAPVAAPAPVATSAAQATTVAVEEPLPGAEAAPDVVTEAASDVVTEPRPPAAPGYDDAGREAVHQVIRERRDVRNGFRPDPIPHEVLIRVLEAAHTAPSVGYSQPWDFVVIRSAKTRRRMHELAERQREAYADSLPKGRAKQFKEIKVEAILETPVNIVVTADRTRGGRHTLGRHTQPQMAPYSAALAVENLWLAARAEGLGVGWVSFFDEDEMVRELGLPEHLEVVAYLCVGYVDSFPAEPELQQQGWAKKRPLSWVVHEEQYGNRALPGEEPHSLLAETLRGIRPLDAKALGEAWDRQKRMTKPAGSLGMLEIISAQLCGLSRKCPPPIPEPACVAIFAGDHGVHAQGVSPWPQEVTAQMVGNFLAGGAVVNAFAKQIGTEVVVVDVGVKSELPGAIQSGRTTGLLPRKVKPGTDDMTQGPAMSREEALKAIEVGIETARDLVAAGNKVLITGDMGIGNTTASAALISVFAGLDPAEVTGRGTGIDDATHAHKIEVIRAALALHQPDPSDPIGVLAAVGGLEHAALAGFVLGAASLRTPVILDGVIAGSAALAAKAIAPEVLAACIAGHRSAEPGHQAALAKLGLRPLIELDLRLGEGTGALLALPLVQSAARSMHDVATFDSAGVTKKA